MQNFNQQDYLKNNQYRDDRNLNARIALHKNYSTGIGDWPTWVTEQMRDIPATATVLEVGCGPAGLWRDHIARIPAGWNITLSDFSPGMVAKAQENLADHADRFTFREIDAQAIPYPDATFDTVIANHMIYHIPDIPQGVREMHRVLKPGGTLIAATNGSGHMRELADLVKSYDGDSGYVFGTDVILDAFSLENGAAVLGEVFPDVELRRYPDGLAVTEVQPLVDYVFSMSTLQDTERVQHEQAGFTAYVTQIMADSGGVIHIKKESGVFIAKR